MPTRRAGARPAVEGVANGGRCTSGAGAGAVGSWVEASTNGKAVAPSGGAWAVSLTFADAVASFFNTTTAGIRLNWESVASGVAIVHGDDPALERGRSQGHHYIEDLGLA